MWCQPPTSSGRAQSAAWIAQQRGFIFISTLLLMSLLIPLSLSALTRLQTDLHISRNLLSSLQALWIARAGVAVGKDWLENSGPQTAFPVSLGPHPFADGSYNVSIDRLGGGRYRVSALGQGADATRRRIEEIVHIPISPRPALSPATGTDFTRISMTTAAEPAGAFQTSALTAEIMPPAVGCRPAARPSPPLPRRGQAPTATCRSLSAA